jgi:hypothetical protein
VVPTQGLFLGLYAFPFAVFLLICLISYDPKDPSLNTKILSNDYTIENYGGIIGSYLADFMMQVFGYASYLFPNRVDRGRSISGFQKKHGKPTCFQNRRICIAVGLYQFGLVLGQYG